MKIVKKILWSMVLLLTFESNLFSQNQADKTIDTDTNSLIEIGFSNDLYFSDNDIIIKKNFSQIKNYRKISRIGLLNIPADTFVSIATYIKDVIFVSWADSNMKQLPDELFALTKIRKISITFPEMSDFPDKLYLLSNLEELSIYKTKIQIIPESIGSFRKLNDLDLQDNQISYISPSIGKLKRLKVLDLSFNNLKTLPNTFCNLTNLGVTNLGYNQLIRLPEPFPKSKSKIYVLNIMFNNLTYLPKDFDKIPIEKTRIYWLGNHWNENDLKLLKTYYPYAFGNQ